MCGEMVEKFFWEKGFFEKKRIFAPPKFSAMEVKQLRDQFKLRLAGVEDGNYCFTMVCDKQFFELAELTDLQDGRLDLRVDMTKTEKLVDVKCHFSGFVMAPCDRCLLPVNIPMEFEDRLIVKLVPTVEEGDNEDDDIWVMDENTYELDIFHFVYESIRLAMPLRIVHADDENGNSTCDPAVLAKLQELSADSAKQDHDPRWDALKNLKLDS